MIHKKLIMTDESKTLLLGCMLASNCMMGCVIYLNGFIGTGKTVFCKGFLKGLGYMKDVKSPTYTIIESYILSTINIYHCDCYRLSLEADLINIGIQDYLHERSIFLIEWPKPNLKFLPLPDIIIDMYYYNYSEKYRKVIIKTISNLGQNIVNSSLYIKKFKYEVETKI